MSEGECATAWSVSVTAVLARAKHFPVRYCITFITVAIVYIMCIYSSVHIDMQQISSEQVPLLQHTEFDADEVYSNVIILAVDITYISIDIYFNESYLHYYSKTATSPTAAVERASSYTPTTWLVKE